MPLYGYGNLANRAFVAFAPELEDGAWKEINTQPHEEAAKNNPASLVQAPVPVGWKIRLQWGISGVIAALAVPSLGALDAAWDGCQRRLFHHLGIAIDSDQAAVRAAADRLRVRLLAGDGTAQNALSYDEQVDFGRQQIALTREGGPLFAEAKKAKLTDVLQDIDKATEALAVALGRPTGEKRKSPSKQIREAVDACAASFNAVHDQIAWLLEKTPPGSERDRLTALLAPLEALLERAAPANPPASPAPANTPQPG